MRFGDLPNSAMFNFEGQQYIHFSVEHTYPQEVTNDVSGKMQHFPDDNVEVEFLYVHVNGEELPMTGVSVEF